MSFVGVLIGLDIGTSKLSAAALDGNGGRVVGAVSAPTSAALRGAPEAAELDPGRVVGSSMGLIADLLGRAGVPKEGVSGIGVTGQMHGVVLVDRDGRALTPFVSWQDRRGALRCRASGRTYAEELSWRLGERATEASGCRAATGYGGVTLLRMSEEGPLPRGATALTMPGMVVRELCGAAAIDPTEAASWGIFDVRHGERWLAEAEEALGGGFGALPETLATGSRAGALRPEAASAAGLPAGIPVAVALGDNQASFLGSVPSLPDTVLFNIGTGGQVSVPVDHFMRAEGLETRPLVNGLRLLVGASLCGGRAYEVLEAFFAGVGRELFGADRAGSLLDAMNRLAGRAEPECGGLRAGTVFEGTREDPARRGSLAGIGASNLTPANLARAIIVGIVDELMCYYGIARRAAGEPAQVAGAGGAIRDNPVLREEIERRVGAGLWLAPQEPEAAVGAALSGGVAAGVYEDWQAACGWGKGDTSRAT